MRALGVAALALGLSGCIVVTEDDTGTLALRWSIEGDVRPADCDLVGARRLELVMRDRFDDWVYELEPRCDDFFVRAELEPGRYEVQATLVDRFDRAVSFSLVDSILVLADRELVLELDFGVDDLL